MLTANYDYSRSTKENLPLPIQIKLCKKNHSIFAAFLVYAWNFQSSEQKNEPHSSSISEVIDSEGCYYLNA